MIIKGLQKLTLLDFPGRVAATVFTPGCNLRCPFCHNGTLVLVEDSERIPESEVLAYLSGRSGVLDGVCITGGEPLMQPGLEDFMAAVKALGLAVKLDTNGFFTARLKAILDGGLADYVAMDIKNAPARYAETAGVPGLSAQPALASIELLRRSGVEHEFRTTVVRELHRPDDIVEIAKLIAGDGRYFLQNFVDSGDVIGEDMTAYGKDELQDILKSVRVFVPNAELRGV